MWEEGKPYLCVPRQAELSRVTRRVLGSACCIGVPVPGLLPSATRALIRACWGHTQLQARGWGAAHSLFVLSRHRH